MDDDGGREGGRANRPSWATCGAWKNSMGRRRGQTLLICAAAVLLASFSVPGARAQKGDKVLNGKDGMRGIYWTEDQFFVPGTTGSEWPRPEFEDIERINFAETDPQKQITDWQTTSWAEVNCCRQLRGTDIWEHKDTGVPDCICRDFLEKTGQKSVAFCSLRQSCENALRDWNKVFGEGYMAKGGKGDWNTESPARSCTRSRFDLLRQRTSYSVEPCGRPAENGETWSDPLGRVVGVFEDTVPARKYGTIETPPEEIDPDGYHWVPGDVPAEQKRYQGYRAGDAVVQEGIMAGSPVYPGGNHSIACLNDALSDACMDSPQMKWTEPENARQADCMFAVLRGICAYHFWDCDSSYSDKIYNSVCKDTCDDIPKLCGRIPLTGEPLEFQRFTIQQYFNLGCTNKRRQYVKDCTARGARAAPSRGLAAAVVAAAAAATWRAARRGRL